MTLGRELTQDDVGKKFKDWFGGIVTICYEDERGIIYLVNMTMITTSSPNTKSHGQVSIL